MPTFVTETIGTGLDYADPTLWEAATDALDLVTLDEVRIGSIAEDVQFNADVDILTDGGVQDATRYRELSASVGFRYDPITDTGGGFSADEQQVVRMREDFARVSYILIDNIRNATTNYRCVRYENQGQVMDGVVLRMTAGTGGTKIGFQRAGSGFITVRNCLLIGGGGSGGFSTGYSGTLTGMECYNCGAYNVDQGGGVGDGFADLQVLRNCWAYGSGDEDFQAGSTDIDYCADGGDGTAGGANSVSGITDSDFNDPANGDFRPVAGSQVLAAGEDQSPAYTLDIIGDTHGTNDGGGVWNIGPYDAEPAPAFLSVDAPLASAATTAIAPVALPEQGVAAPIATAATTALPPVAVPEESALPLTANATATALPPVAIREESAEPETATAATTAIAPVAIPEQSADPDLAAAAATALEPVVGSQLSVDPDLATASTTALPPGVSQQLAADPDLATAAATASEPDNLDQPTTAPAFATATAFEPVASVVGGGAPTVIGETIGTGLDYADPGLWEAATDSIDKIGTNTIYRGLIQDDTAFTADVNIALDTGGTASETNYRELTHGAGFAYDPMDNSGAKFEADEAEVLRLTEDYSRVTGLKLENTRNATTNYRCLRYASSTTVVMTNCVLVMQSGTGGGVKSGTIRLSGDLVSRNCIAIGGNGLGGFTSGFGGTSTSHHLYNCGAYNVNHDGLTGTGFAVSMEMRNCWAYGCVEGFEAGQIDSDFCASSDASAQGVNSLTGRDVNVDLEDPANGDFRPGFSSTLIGAGTDLSAVPLYPFTTDFLGDTHGTYDGTDWNIGPFDAPLGVGVLPDTAVATTIAIAPVALVENGVLPALALATATALPPVATNNVAQNVDADTALAIATALTPASTNNGWTVLPNLATYAHVFHVDPDNGNDNHDGSFDTPNPALPGANGGGLGLNGPLQTIGAAMDLVDTFSPGGEETGVGFANAILLRSGALFVDDRSDPNPDNWTVNTFRRSGASASFNDQWRWSGESAARPFIIDTYGGTDRVTISTAIQNNGGGSDASVTGWMATRANAVNQYVFIRGVDFYCRVGDPNRTPPVGQPYEDFILDSSVLSALGNADRVPPGLGWASAGRGIHFEDVVFSWGRQNDTSPNWINWAGLGWAEVDYEAPVFFRCHAYDHWGLAGGGAHSSGFHMATRGQAETGDPVMDGMKLRECYMDHCGWMDPAFGYAGTGKTIFNHNFYLNTHLDNCEITDCVITRGAADAGQFRSGGAYDRNFHWANPLGVNFGDQSDTSLVPDVNAVSGTVNDNVFLGSIPLLDDGGSQNERGLVIQLGNADTVEISGNIVGLSNQEAAGGSTRYGNTAFVRLRGSQTDQGNPLSPHPNAVDRGCSNIDIHHNTLLDACDLVRIQGGGTPGRYVGNTVRNNLCLDRHPVNTGSELWSHEGSGVGGDDGFVYSNNRQFHTTESAPFDDSGASPNNLNHAAWLTRLATASPTQDGGNNVELQATFSDAPASFDTNIVADYVRFAYPEQGFTPAQDTDAENFYYAQMRLQSRSNWDDRMTASAINEYVRNRFIPTNLPADGEQYGAVPYGVAPELAAGGQVFQPNILAAQTALSDLAGGGVVFSPTATAAVIASLELAAAGQVFDAAAVATLIGATELAAFGQVFEAMGLGEGVVGPDLAGGGIVFEATAGQAQAVLAQLAAAGVVFDALAAENRVADPDFAAAGSVFQPAVDVSGAAMANLAGGGEAFDPLVAVAQTVTPQLAAAGTVFAPVVRGEELDDFPDFLGRRRNDRTFGG